MKTFTWSFRTPVTISGNTVDAVDTSVTQCWLRRYDWDGVSTYTYAEEIAGTAVGGGTGRFSFDISTEGFYQLWIAAYPNVTAGNRRDEFHGGSGKYQYITDNDLPYLPYDSDNSVYDADNVVIDNVGNATAGDHALNRTTADARYAQLTSNNSWSGTNLFQDVLTMGGATIDMDGNEIENLPDAPTSDNSAACKLYVDTAVSGISVTPHQESINKIRLLIGGSEQTAKVYTSYAVAQNYCRTFPATNTHRFCIDVEGAGSGGTAITVTNGAISGNSAFNNYVSMKGVNQNLRLDVDDDTFSVTAGTVIIENFKIYRDDAGVGTPVFTNFIFKDCYFDFDTASLELSSCTFRGTCYIKNTGTIVLTSSIGGVVLTNGTLPATMVGFDGLSTSDF